MVGRLVAWGALAIVAFDLLASVASRAIGFPYGYATVGSWLIYAAFGFAIGRRADVGAASLGVAIIAGIEATIGWALSWAIGPGRTPSGAPRLGVLVTTVILVAVTGAAIGALAGFVGRRITRLTDISRSRHDRSMPRPHRDAHAIASVRMCNLG